MIEIYLLNIQDLEVKDYVNNIPDNFLNQVNKYNEENQRKRSFFSWYLLYLKLKMRNIDVGNLKVNLNANCKPLIEGIHFNITHSHNLVALALANEEVGIDLGYVEFKDNSKLAKKIMTDEEYNKSLTGNICFYMIWTKKEAYLKRKGLALNLVFDKELKLEDVATHLIKVGEDNYYLSVSPSKYKLEFVSLD